MELQLGLALHPPTYNLPKGNFDFKKKEIVVGLDYACECLDGKIIFNNKRLFEEAFVEESNINVDLSNLLLWNGQPNEEEDDRKRIKKETSLPLTGDEVQSQIVGWPPLNSWRKKFLHVDHRQLIDGRRHGQNHQHVVAHQEGNVANNMV